MTSRLRPLAAVLAAAALLVTVLVVVSSSQSDGTTTTADTSARVSTSHLDGIPQDGVRLGRADAPIRIVELADLQCPFCAEASATTVRKVIDGAVRDGRARIELRDLAFLGPDSTRLAQAAAAAGLQDRYWQAAEVLFARQGQENSGYATDAFLRDALATVEGLDVDRALQDRSSAEVQQVLGQAQSIARQAEAQSTPTFLVSERGGPLRTVTQQELLELVAA